MRRFQHLQHCHIESKGVVILLINVDASQEVTLLQIKLSGSGSASLGVIDDAAHFAGKASVTLAPRSEYVLKAVGDDLAAQEVMLNGAPLTVKGSGESARLPDLHSMARKVKAGDGDEGEIVVAPRSIGYYVLHDALLPACVH